MSAEAFVDTNVLLYAHDRDAGRRHAVAAKLVRQLWESRSAAISAQVLHELAVNLQRRLSKPLPPDEVEAILTDYLAWEVVPNDGRGALEAWRVQRTHRISYWDALIVVAAQRSGAKVLYTEDLNAGQKYEGVEAVNPFR